ncbi:hypothetical protein D3C77_495190 [compost metagenome]
MLQSMVVAQHHAQLGLPVMIVNGYIQLVGEPADHFRIEWLTRTAHHSKTTFDRRGKLRASSNQQAKSGG